jgi:hypothetical protein
MYCILAYDINADHRACVGSAVLTTAFPSHFVSFTTNPLSRFFSVLL